jgi:type IV pilus assembly protein PilA
MNRMRRDHDSEAGFSLPELLVVLLLIGILAAIALTTLLSQKDKGSDASAKADVRSLMTHVEACHATEEDYRECTTAAELGTTGLSLGSDVGQVRVKTSDKNSYTLEAHSTTSTLFRISRDADGDRKRTCTRPKVGGCQAGGSW